jgi:hypothetical protein
MPWQFMLFVVLLNAFFCLLGVISNKFNDNIMQRIGMGLLCIASLARADTLWNKMPEMSLLRSWIHIGIFFFAFGTWYKVTAHAWLLAHPKYWSWFHFPPHRRKDDEHVSE